MELKTIVHNHLESQREREVESDSTKMLCFLTNAKLLSPDK